MRIGRLTLNRQVFLLLWDLFMVWAAVVNLSLILFDLSYLWLRPTYFKVAPILTQIYDPVLGIEPHPVTVQMDHEVDMTGRILSGDAPHAHLDERLNTLADLSRHIVSGGVFERSGQARSRIIIARLMMTEVGTPAVNLDRAGEFDKVAAEFWSGPDARLTRRIDLYDSRIRPLLEENYYRKYGRGGHLADHFWIIDLPFLILFWVEFATRWLVALRRKTHARWYFFPIFNWYDLLGLIPLHEFRVFRLLRAVSMYMRLRRSELSAVGKDFASRIVEYVSNIITEEVSDRVALRLLDDYAEEIRDGTHLEIIESTFGLRRRRIEGLIVEHVSLLLTDEDALDSLRALLRLNLSKAVESSTSLHAVPLPKAVLDPIVKVVGEVILDTTLETLTTTVRTEEGQDALGGLATSVLDAVLASPALTEATNLAEEIALHVIEHMKATVKVKKWALPDEEQRRRRQLKDDPTS